jgi:hypothetical protein
VGDGGNEVGGKCDVVTEDVTRLGERFGNIGKGYELRKTVSGVWPQDL